MFWWLLIGSWMIKFQNHRPFEFDSPCLVTLHLIEVFSSRGFPFLSYSTPRLWHESCVHPLQEVCDLAFTLSSNSFLMLIWLLPWTFCFRQLPVTYHLNDFNYFDHRNWYSLAHDQTYAFCRHTSDLSQITSMGSARPQYHLRNHSSEFKCDF